MASLMDQPLSPDEIGFLTGMLHAALKCFEVRIEQPDPSWSYDVILIPTEASLLLDEVYRAVRRICPGRETTIEAGCTPHDPTPRVRVRIKSMSPAYLRKLDDCL